MTLRVCAAEPHVKSELRALRGRCVYSSESVVREQRDKQAKRDLFGPAFTKTITKRTHCDKRTSSSAAKRVKSTLIPMETAAATSSPAVPHKNKRGTFSQPHPQFLAPHAMQRYDITLMDIPDEVVRP